MLASLAADLAPNPTPAALAFATRATELVGAGRVSEVTALLIVANVACPADQLEFLELFATGGLSDPFAASFQ